jgi:hypothetical protein
MGGGMFGMGMMGGMPGMIPGMGVQGAMGMGYPGQNPMMMMQMLMMMMQMLMMMMQMMMAMMNGNGLNNPMMGGMPGMMGGMPGMFPGGMPGMFPGMGNALGNFLGMPGMPGGFPGGFPGGGFPGGGFPGAGIINGPVQPFNGQTVSTLDSYRVTSEFGPRWGRNHNGIDLAAPTGTPIKSVADGVVTRVANDPGGYGNWVEVRHSDGSTTRYAHMSSFGNIHQGQRIGAGSVIGAVGSTGHSTGPHLHFEWRDPSGRPVNPRQKMNFR